MEDKEILALYWRRDEDAVAESAKKYGHYLSTIAVRILASREDAEEAENDSYLKAWNTIPPQKPLPLAPYLGMLCRQIAIDLRRGRERQKRGGGEYSLSLEELAECVAGGGEPSADLIALTDALNRFLGALPKRSRVVFLQRYFWLLTAKEIAELHGFTEGQVKMLNQRTRQRLRRQLEEEGFFDE